MIQRVFDELFAIITYRLHLVVNILILTSIAYLGCRSCRGVVIVAAVIRAVAYEQTVK